MSRMHRRRAGAVLLVAALLLLVASLFVGCGQGGNYEGTWVQKALPNLGGQKPIVVKKVGDNYSFSSPNGSTSGYMVHTAPSNGKFTINALVLNAGSVATQDGGKLKLASGKDTVEITVSGDTMTMVFPGVQGDFTFSRVTTK